MKPAKEREIEEQLNVRIVKHFRTVCDNPVELESTELHSGKSPQKYVATNS